jgi:hypothetical protein
MVCSLRGDFFYRIGPSGGRRCARHYMGSVSLGTAQIEQTLAAAHRGHGRRRWPKLGPASGTIAGSNQHLHTSGSVRPQRKHLVLTRWRWWMGRRRSTTSRTWSSRQAARSCATALTARPFLWIAELGHLGSSAPPHGAAPTVGGTARPSSPTPHGCAGTCAWSMAQTE